MKLEFFSEHTKNMNDYQRLDKFVQIQLLCKDLISNKKNAQKQLKVGIIGDDQGNCKFGLNELLSKQCHNYLRPLALCNTRPDISIFPFGSWTISFKFKLRKPYISQDDINLYIIDNPVKKEWIFKLPYIAPSQWKGTLRSAMVNELVEKADTLSDDEFAARRLNLRLMFGDEKGEEQGAIKGLAEYLNEKKPYAIKTYRKKINQYFSIESDETFPHNAGWLHFYPTYFTQIDLELINPHDRKTGSGIQPIYFETVPYSAEATFTLLYVPLDYINEDIDKTEKQTISNLCLVAEGIRAMMTHYGFGAKTSSGFGVAKNCVEKGKIFVNAKGNNHGKVWSKCVQSTSDSVSAELPLCEFKNFNDLMSRANSFKQIVTETEGEN